MEKNGPRVYADERADSYEQSETHHMYSCSPGRVVYIRLFPRNACIAVLYCAEGCGCRLCTVQGRAQAFGLGELLGVITGGDQFTLEEIHELFRCCSALTIILTGSHPIYFISAMLGVKKKNEEIAAEAERADAARAIAGADQLALEEIPELFWCCTELQMIHRGCSPAYRWHVPGYPSAV